MKRIDHLIVKVDDLHAGVEEFTDAGFAVFYGVRKEKAYNALIYLQDGSLLELVDMKGASGFAKTLIKLGVLRVLSTLSTAFNRIGHYLFKDGRLLDYVIYSADIDASQTRFGKHSTKVLGIGRRKKPNGTVVRSYWLNS
ncbi:MAG: VOC family protein [Chloroflexales bacterium]|nr:VOC family protein [Chloroflexales bacterium]